MNDESVDFQEVFNKCNTWAILNGWAVQKKLVYVRAGCAWTKNENASLIQSFLRGKSLESISNLHGRSPAVIYKKIIDQHVSIFEKVIKKNYKTKNLQKLITANFDEIYTIIYNLNQIRNDYYTQLKRNKTICAYTHIEQLFMVYLVVKNKFLQINPQELFCCSNNVLINIFSYSYIGYNHYFNLKIYNKNLKFVLKTLKSENK